MKKVKQMLSQKLSQRTISEYVYSSYSTFFELASTLRPKRYKASDVFVQITLNYFIYEKL